MLRKIGRIWKNLVIILWTVQLKYFWDISQPYYYFNSSLNLTYHYHYPKYFIKFFLHSRKWRGFCDVIWNFARIYIDYFYFNPWQNYNLFAKRNFIYLTIRKITPPSIVWDQN